MTRLFLLFLLICTAVACTAIPLAAQDGSIEQSWNRAGKEKSSRDIEPFKSAPPRNTPSTWDKRTSQDGTQWRYAEPGPAGKNLHGENRVLIDSLATLFCLPSSYIRSLHYRNDAARPAQASQNATTDFQYQQKSAQERAPGGSGQALEQLNRELLRLLEQCVYGG